MDKRAHELKELHMSTEDPYRSFRRGLIAEARGRNLSARGNNTSHSRNRAHTSMGSKQSKHSKNDAYLNSLNADSEDQSQKDERGGKFESRYDRKAGRSMTNLNTNKVSIGKNHREYANFLADIGTDNQIGRGSMHSSNMMIEISDLDVKDPMNRSNTITGKYEGNQANKGANEDNYNLKF